MMQHRVYGLSFTEWAPIKMVDSKTKSPIANYVVGDRERDVETMTMTMTCTTIHEDIHWFNKIYDYNETYLTTCLV